MGPSSHEFIIDNTHICYRYILFNSTLGVVLNFKGFSIKNNDCFKIKNKFYF